SFSLRNRKQDKMSFRSFSLSHVNSEKKKPAEPLEGRPIEIPVAQPEHSPLEGPPTVKQATNPAATQAPAQ
ncbi:hypothetical protein, partial [Thalassospira alkalitolerans]